VAAEIVSMAVRDAGEASQSKSSNNFEIQVPPELAWRECGSASLI
jgi:hypothetical protein